MAGTFQVTAKAAENSVGWTRLPLFVRKSALFFWTVHGPFSFRQDEKKMGGGTAPLRPGNTAPLPRRAKKPEILTDPPALPSTRKPLRHWASASSGQSPLPSGSAFRRNLRPLPCPSSPHKISDFAGAPDGATGGILSGSLYKFSSSSIHREATASLGIRQSPRGLRATEPTLGPSGRQLRLNCWEKKRR